MILRLEKIDKKLFFFCFVEVFRSFRFGTPPQRKSSSRWVLASVFFSLCRRTTNFTTTVIGSEQKNKRKTLFFSLFSSDALMTSSINCVTSVLAGFVVFSTLGHMAKVSQKTVEQVIEDKGRNSREKKTRRTNRVEKFCFFYFPGSELIFIVYPHTIALMKGSTIWAILFFFMLITLGIDSTVS